MKIFSYFETVKNYYEKGYYTDEEVKLFVEDEKITKEEFKEICKKDYTE